MKNLTLLIIILSLFLLPTISFAYSRQEIVDQSLTKAEMDLAISSKDTAKNSYNKEKTAASEVASSDEITVVRVPVSDEPRTNVEPASASGEREEAVENAFYIAAGYDGGNIHYSEWSDQNKLDEDYGNQYGYYVSAGYKSANYYEMLLGEPFIESYFRYSEHSIKYKGAASNGFTSWPFNTKQKSRIQRFGIKMGAARDFSDKGKLFGYLDAGKRIWQRGENGVVDNVLVYAEKYEWTYLGFGLGVNYRLLPKLSIGIDGEWMFATSSKMRADLYEGGTFNIKHVSGTEAKIPIKYCIAKNISFDLTPYFTCWHIGHSDTITLAGIPGYYEPDSETHEEGLLTGLTYTF